MASGDGHRSSAHSTIVEYLKVLVWPLVAVFLIISFWKPLQEIAGMAPELIRGSETIQVGSVTLQVRQSLAKKATDEVREALRDIRSDELRQLMTNNDSRTFLYCTTDASDDGVQMMQRLEARKLVTKLSAEELRKEDEKDCRFGYGFAVTPLYQSVQQFIFALITELVNDISRGGAVKTVKGSSKK